MKHESYHRWKKRMDARKFRLYRKHLVRIAGDCSRFGRSSLTAEYYFPLFREKIRVPRSLRAQYNQWCFDGGDVPF